MVARTISYGYQRTNCSYSFRDVNGDEFLYADAGKTGQKTTLTSYKMDCAIVNCHQPTNLKADDVGFYSVTASWTPGDEDQEKWEVVCRTSYGAPTATTVGTEVTTTSYTFSNLNTNYTYYIYVRGIKGEEKSKWSRCLQIMTKNAKAVPTDVEADNETGPLMELRQNGTCVIARNIPIHHSQRSTASQPIHIRSRV